MHGPCRAGKNCADHQSCVTVTPAAPSLMEVPFLRTFLDVRSQVHLEVLCPILHRLQAGARALSPAEMPRVQLL